MLMFVYVGSIVYCFFISNVDCVCCFCFCFTLVLTMLVLGLLVLKLTVFFVETLVVITDDMPCCNNSLIVLTVL